jgi:hypothetical protein
MHGRRRSRRCRYPVDRGFGAARQHDLGIAERDHAGRIADRMRTGRASGDDGMVRALQPVLDRDIAGGEIAEAPRDKERGKPPRTALLQQQRGLIDAAQPADAGADGDAGRDLVLVALGLPAGIPQRLRRRGHGEDNEIVDLALLLRLHPIIGIESAVRAVAARNAAGDLRRKVGYVEGGDRAGAAFTSQNARPARLDPATKRGHHPQSGDDHTPHRSSSIQPRRAGAGCEKAETGFSHESCPNF